VRIVCALETSARPPSVALRVGSEEHARELGEARRHASDLLPTLAGMLEERGATPRDLELICVGTGPGSYTGLRVGIATALGLARGAGAELVSVPSVEALAFDLLAPGEEGTVLLDARARELYVARYRHDGDGVTEVLAPRVTTAQELELPSSGPILGDATVAEAAGLNEEQRARLVTGRPPRADAVLALGLARHERVGATPLSEVEPLYLRPFAATARKR
jgi:tRNA threonylcarbamoyladenosine biosynthesis protein TsaB